MSRFYGSVCIYIRPIYSAFSSYVLYALGSRLSWKKEAVKRLNKYYTILYN